VCGGGGGMGQGREMTQTMYAHVNKYIIKNILLIYLKSFTSKCYKQNCIWISGKIMLDIFKEYQ
jgi:hypothetical protein